MQEEQPNFKVTDRRLFNADGSPRDLPPEEKPEPPAAVAQEAPAAAPPAPEAQPEAQTEASAGAAPEPPAAEAEDEFTEEDLADARDPTSFVNFLMSIASNAASALGMMEHPVTHQRDVDVEVGKHWIDILGMLQKRTEGNLTPQEKRMLEGLLADLRMQYVSLINSPQQPRRFTGSDITGGR
jgi:flagellar motor switch/type III secretory pathway protein FliN